MFFYSCLYFFKSRRRCIILKHEKSKSYSVYNLRERRQSTKVHFWKSSDLPEEESQRSPREIGVRENKKQTLSKRVQGQQADTGNFKGGQGEERCSQ
jgi:hypothetical protein